MTPARVVGPCFRKLHGTRDHPVFHTFKVLTCRQPGNWFVWNRDAGPFPAGVSRKTDGTKRGTRGLRLYSPSSIGPSIVRIGFRTE